MRHKLDKDTKALSEELAALPVFAELDKQVVDVVAQTGRVVHLPPAWALVTESQPADSCYVLLSGTTQVRHAGAVLARLGAGDLVGEAALVEHRTRNASAITETEVRALRLGFEDLAGLFATHRSLEQVFRHEWERRTAGA